MLKKAYALNVVIGLNLSTTLTAIPMCRMARPRFVLRQADIWFARNACGMMRDKMKKSKIEFFVKVAIAIVITLLSSTLIFCACAIAGVISADILWIIWFVTIFVDIGTVIFIITILDRMDD